MVFIAIKEAGGVTIARNPQNAEFSIMPEHAIATEMIDFYFRTPVYAGSY